VISSYTNSQDLNRYSYVNDNPLRYTDPTGHMRVEEAGGKRGCSDLKYCRGGKPKPKAELDAMRNAKKEKTTSSQPWTYSHNVEMGLQLGPVEEFFAPDYNSDDYNGLPHSWGITHTDNNFHLTFQTTYNETSGMHISEMQYSNQYDGLARIISITVNQEMIYSDDAYLPSPGNGVYTPIEGKTGGNYNGNDPVTIELTVSYLTNTGNGDYLQPVSAKMVLPSLQNLKDFIETGQVSNSIYVP
jgi:hypothetical protein